MDKMKSMKGLGVNKVLGTIKRRTLTVRSPANASADETPDPQGDTPDAIAVRAVRQFCESGGPNSSVRSGDEVTYLPAIVEAAESSPAAAAECARIIRKFLSKDFASNPSYQYNAIMLIRILIDNPGASFSRNLDKKFVDTAKELLRSGRDPSVRTMLMETLDTLEFQKADLDGLGPLIEMWKKEKERAYKAYGHRMPPSGPDPRMMDAHALPFDAHSQNYFARNVPGRTLPPAVELASRLEEARTSANLLSQVVGNTPPQEILASDLIKEFADRCQNASRSVQAYMIADSPAPDNDTMESLIDTNEQLQSALNQHQRAVLSARKQLGIGDQSPSTSPSPQNQTNGSQQPPHPHRSQASSSGAIPPPIPARNNGKGKETDFAPLSSHPNPLASHKPLPEDPEEDPFRDPPTEEASSSRAGPSSSRIVDDAEPRLGFEPFNPGFRPAVGYSAGHEEGTTAGKLPLREAGSSEAIGGGSSKMPDSKSRVPQKDDDDDLYESTPKKTEPMYRY